MWFPTRSDISRPVQSQKQARSLKYFGFKKKRDSTTSKALISFAVTAKLICAFVLAYADCWFSQEAAHLRHETFMEFQLFFSRDAYIFTGDSLVFHETYFEYYFIVYFSGDCTPMNQ